MQNKEGWIKRIDGGHEHVADYLLYALYFTEQTSDYGDKHAEQ